MSQDILEEKYISDVIGDDTASLDRLESGRASGLRASHQGSYLEPPQNENIELQRINTYRLQQQYTVGSTRNASPPEQWLPMGAGKPYPSPLPSPEEYIVEFEGADDPMHPHNWPMNKRYYFQGL